MSYYTAKTEDQLAKEGLLPEGEYDFEIVDCIDKPSKKGSPMYTVKLRVYATNGNSSIIFDYVVFGNNMGERKFRHLAYACGLDKDYEAGTLDNEAFINRTGKCTIIIQEGSVDYPTPKNTVKDYIKSDGTVIRKEVTKVEDDGDSIPF